MIIKEYSGLWGASRSYFFSKIVNKDKRYLVICDDFLYERLLNELSFFLTRNKLSPFPSYMHEPFEKSRILPSIVGERITTLLNLLDGKPAVVFTNIYAVAKKLPPKETIISSICHIKKNGSFDRDELIYYLDYLGFIHVEIVTDPGEYSFRGSIVDFYPVNNDLPLRVEFFDDEIENIFEYNLETQKRVNELREFLIIPATEGIYDLDEFKKAVKNTPIEEKAEIYGKFAGHHWYAPLIYQNMYQLFDFLNDFDIIYIGEGIQKEIDRFYSRLSDCAAEYEIPEGLFRANFIMKNDLYEYLSDREVVVLSEVISEGSIKNPEYKSTQFLIPPTKNSYQALSNMVEIFKKNRENGIATVFSTESEKFQNVTKDFFRDYEIDVYYPINHSEISKERLNIYPYAITGGFFNEKDKLVLLRDEEIFGFVRRGRKKEKKEVFRTNISDLEPGDYVVHIDYGIGIFRGLEHKTIGGIEGDYIAIEYEGGELLFVSLENISHIQKYIGKGDVAVKLNSLQNTRWKKLKEQAQKSAKKVAIDLLKLYAERKAKLGFSFKDDGTFMKIIEDSFEYDETEDQINAIRDVIADMESEKAMDRLICGDVGFGKTEVAIRAACKCCASGKQVALLAPTTILVKQHFETFKRRFSNLPFKIEYVSRFKSKKEINETLRKVANGEIDIIIGTHRLLSNDVSFHDLGLLIIDEEQRFGVAHKEKIKNLKSNIDVLAMSATPIPRTLQFSLAGIRDISIIETPPEERLPVLTNIINNEEDVKKAIIHELKRGGQVYYLYNDLSKIEEKAYSIKSMLPEAEVAIAHGQMDPEKVEKTLDAFYDGKIDVLVCSTIIENGIDIPNVNTIIIDGADKFGLSQLYQLKGRVGRSRVRGYCYLYIRNFNVLSTIAKKRLKIIQQMSELGSGFKIASYDLQLRGAGELLGAEQSGHISSIGYELYIQMINDAVKELRGNSENIIETEIQSTIPYFIPADYILEPSERMRWYNRLTNIDKQLFNQYLEELTFNYGDPPPPVLNLLKTIYLKSIASRIGIKKITIMNKQIKFTLEQNNKLDLQKMLNIFSELKLKGNFAQDNSLLIYSESPLDNGIVVVEYLCE
ncbi:transcription-repair coupling factor [Calditerrivibrio nitroreducens]|uniref:Transcription-repair-coupling factor n=1 Tax=Calditerrivibrio nitroreducens (strain DSM 19672 / NBRC 101217 / Yu37-1) TaxID=768670 RepID=E4TG58_CALNY|nr:transcription-repair coupling factor [Calditerrivibrio nitroreducens]ADR19645.1 transcription-repair coupling factor [Calditerrivibrio nitroreducens DSM 19672]